MSEKEFDRGKCFTFFSSYRKQGERIKEILWPEKALEYYRLALGYNPHKVKLLLDLAEMALNANNPPIINTPNPAAI